MEEEKTRRQGARALHQKRHERKKSRMRVCSELRAFVCVEAGLLCLCHPEPKAALSIGLTGLP